MRYFIGFLVTIGLIILLIVLLFSGGGNDTQVPKTQKKLYTYADTAAIARLTVDGPVNSDVIHEQIKITVGQDSVVVQQIQGYDNHVVFEKKYPNNENAYGNFLRSLQLAGFTQGDKSKDLEDYRGFCPTNNRYIYEFFDGSETLERYWATDCGKPQTYLGSRELTNTLFKEQVPKFDDVFAERDLLIDF